MIYTGDTPPQAEAQLIRKPIKMTPKYPREKLDPKSRIHYAKTYTVEHNLRVLIIGKIHENSKGRFLADLAQVQSYIKGMDPPDMNEDDEQ
jgi:hypothetical protein